MEEKQTREGVRVVATHGARWILYYQDIASYVVYGWEPERRIVDTLAITADLGEAFRKYENGGKEPCILPKSTNS